MTRFLSSIFIAVTISTALFAQEFAPTQPSPAAILHPGPPLPSAIVKPAIDTIQQTLTMLRPEKWKISNEASQLTQNNLSSIQTDIRTTLPPLLATADQKPDSVVQLLPAFRNITALYDVLLRVTQVATLSAPTQQIVALQEAMDSLDKSRRTLGDNIQSSALNQEQQAHDLQAQLTTLQSTPPPPPVVCPTTPAAKKRKPLPKPTQKPAAPATPQAAAAPH